MAIPSRAEAARILMNLNPAGWLLTHSTAVAEVGAFLADHIRAAGHDLPADLPETAALLHDIDKTPPLRELRAKLGHGHAGAAWLTVNGYDELAGSVASHPATRLADEAAFLGWLDESTLAEKVVAYADKRVTLDLVSMNDRFAKWQSSHPDRAATIARGLPLANELERLVCEAAGLSPTDVGRFAWVRLPSAT